MKSHLIVVTMAAMSLSSYADTVYVPSPSELPDGWSLTVFPDSTGRGSITNKNVGGELGFQFTQGDQNKTDSCWASLSTTNFDGLTLSQITALNIRLYGTEGDREWQPPKFVFALAKSPTSLSNRFIEWIPWSDGIAQSVQTWQTLDALVDGSWYCPWVGKTYSTLAGFVTEYPESYFADEFEILDMMSTFSGKSFNLGHANWINESEKYNDNNRGVVDWFEVGIDGLNTKYMLNAVPGTDTGDFDEDGDVDGNDFLAWQIGYGIDVLAMLADGDANGDGAVDHSDFVVWRDQFGTVAASLSAQGVAIPEPSSMMLLGLSLAVVLLRFVNHRDDS